MKKASSKYWCIRARPRILPLNRNLRRRSTRSLTRPGPGSAACRWLRNPSSPNRLRWCKTNCPRAAGVCALQAVSSRGHSHIYELKEGVSLIFTDTLLHLHLCQQHLLSAPQGHPEFPVRTSAKLPPHFQVAERMRPVVEEEALSSHLLA